MLSSTTTSSEYVVRSQPANLVDLLRLRAQEQPTRTAYTFLLDGETQEAHLSYADLERRARVIGARLQALGATGARVLLLYPPGLEYAAAFFGCLYAGALAVPAYPPRMNRSMARLQAVVADAQATFALTTAAALSRMRALFAADDPLHALRWLATDELDDAAPDVWREPLIEGDTPAFLQYTSGSTATPKGVVVSHANLLHNEALIKRAFRQTSASVIVGWLPLYHDMGLIGNVLQPLFLGARCVLMSPTAFLQRPARWLEAISKYKATTSGGPNFAYELCAARVTAEQRATLDLSSWTVAFNGAEPVRAETLTRFAETFAACGFRREAFQPCYGLAEATLIVSGGRQTALPLVRELAAHELERSRVVDAARGDERAGAQARALVGCGEVPADERIVIVEPQELRRCEPDEIGEIWIAGRSVAGGYWNRPAETEQTFRARLADGDGPFLRTGDLGFVKSGQLFVTGRLKDLIVVRGRNHYPQDIELTVERSHSALRPGCGAAFCVEADGEERLVVVQEVEPRQLAAASDMLEIIRQAVVEEHEVTPHAIVLIKPGSIPKTSSGKIQRHACRVAFVAESLPVLAEWRATAGAVGLTAEADELLNAAGPREVETWLVAQLAARLGVKCAQIDATQPLTRYGLDSLAVVELAQSFERTLGVRLPLAVLLQSPSIAELAAEVCARLDHPAESAPRAIAPAGQRSTDEGGALASGQRALWFMYQMAPESAAYNLSFAARIHTELDVAAFRRALQKLLDRHASLRTTFSERECQPVRVIHDGAQVDFNAEPAAAWSEELLQARLVAEAQRTFDLAHGPLLRVNLFTRARAEHVLLLVVHHIVADFWSLALMAHELGLLYEAERGGAQAVLPRLGATYADFARWQTDMLHGAEGARLWAYWQEQLSGELPALNFPTDRPRPPVQTYNGAAQPFRLSVELTERLKQLSRAHGTTLYTLLLAAFQTLLHRYTGQTDIVVGSPTAGRSCAEWGGVVGYFVNPVALRARPAGHLSFEQFLAQTHNTVISALAHQDYPFPLLVERLQPARDASRTPLFQAMFILHKSHLSEQPELASFALGASGARLRLGALELESVALAQQVAQFDLTLMMAEVDGALAGSFQYNADLFEPDTFARVKANFEQLLESIVAAPAQRLAELPLLTTNEERQLLVEWNETGRDFHHAQTLHGLFEEQAARSPEAVALVAADERLTYSELNRRANRLAHRLRALGVRPETPVGICLRRTPEMIVALVGVLKAGGAYVPLDPAYPLARIAIMLEDARIPVLLTQRDLAAQLPCAETRVFCLDDEHESLAHESDENPAACVDAQNLAYVIYTSGSTGRPKGVAITHRNAVAFADWAQATFTETELSAVLASTSICFDLSIFEIFVPLARGGRVLLAENALELPTLPTAGEVTLVNTVPSALTELLRDGCLPPSVRVVNLAGEPLLNPLVQQAYRQTTVEKVFNLYGPSEDTTYSTFALTKRGDDESPTIGRPIANTRVYLLDAQLRPVPLGVPGELCLGGAGLARGYLNRPDLTAERFIPHPFSSEPGARLYKTGDLARYRKNGELEYLGRGDAQVKVRGYRIELGEVETVLATHPSVREAVVVARERRGGDKRLVAFIVPREPTLELRANELRAHMKERLPDYMIPAAFVALDELPLTPNGKIDRRALPASEAVAAATESYVAPRTDVEREVAGVWAEVLGVARVGVEDNFFELGGHSLLATQVVSALRSACRVELTVRNVFETPTVAHLAAIIERQRAAPPPAASATIQSRRNRKAGQLAEQLSRLSDEEVAKLLQQRKLRPDTGM